MNINYISRNIGLALVLNAAFMFLSVIVSLCYGRDAAFSPLLLSAVVTLAVGAFPLLFVRRGGAVTIKEGFFTIISTWFLVSVFGAFPYLLWGDDFTPINAWFESVSGYTTTGSTILDDIESLPHSLLFWRSSTHYIGGLGVVVFMVLILPNYRNVFGLRLSGVEMTSLSKENYKFKVSETAKIILSVYVALTLLQTLLLTIAGVGFFDALNHSMSISATGGFSTRNASAAAFQSPVVEVIMIFFMYVASLHFGLIYLTFAKRSSKIYKDPVFRFYTIMLVVSIIFTTTNLLIEDVEDNFLTALRHSAFMNISAASSTGFATTEAQGWPVFSLMILFYFSYQGACSGSTTGGLKADRMCVWFSSLRARLKRQLHSNAVVMPRFGNKLIDKEVVSDINLFIVFYILVIFIGAMCLSTTGLDLQQSLTTSLACVGNTGLTFGSLSSFGSYNAFPAVSKLIFTIEMFLGRLEIYPILAFIVIRRWR